MCLKKLLQQYSSILVKRYTLSSRNSCFFCISLHNLKMAINPSWKKNASVSLCASSWFVLPVRCPCFKSNRDHGGLRALGAHASALCYVYLDVKREQAGGISIRLPASRTLVSDGIVDINSPGFLPFESDRTGLSISRPTCLFAPAISNLSPYKQEKNYAFSHQHPNTQAVLSFGCIFERANLVQAFPASP